MRVPRTYRDANCKVAMPFVLEGHFLLDLISQWREARPISQQAYLVTHPAFQQARLLVVKQRNASGSGRGFLRRSPGAYGPVFVEKVNGKRLQLNFGLDALVEQRLYIRPFPHTVWHWNVHQQP
jgi:hypothetical protein